MARVRTKVRARAHSRSHTRTHAHPQAQTHPRVGAGLGLSPPPEAEPDPPPITSSAFLPGPRDLQGRDSDLGHGPGSLQAVSVRVARPPVGDTAALCAFNSFNHRVPIASLSLSRPSSLSLTLVLSPFPSPYLSLSIYLFLSLPPSLSLSLSLSFSHFAPSMPSITASQQTWLYARRPAPTRQPAQVGRAALGRGRRRDLRWV